MKKHHLILAMHNHPKNDRWYHLLVNVRGPRVDKLVDYSITLQAIYHANLVIDLTSRKYLKRRDGPTTDPLEPGFIECLMEFPITEQLDFYCENKIRTAFL